MDLRRSPSHVSVLPAHWLPTCCLCVIFAELSPSSLHFLLVLLTFLLSS